MLEINCMLQTWPAYSYPTVALYCIIISYLNTIKTTVYNLLCSFMMYSSMLLLILSTLLFTKIRAKTVTATIYGDNYFFFWYNGEKIIEDPNKEPIPHNAVNFTFEVPYYNNNPG